MKHYLIGTLTALKNTAIAMTVTDVYEYTPEEGNDEEETTTTTITAMYFAGDILQTVQLDSEQFIGFGDYLIFEGGHFTEAAFHDDDDDSDDDETGDDDDSDTDGPDSDAPAA